MHKRLHEADSHFHKGQAWHLLDSSAVKDGVVN
jgi:hypothetical protein